MLQYGMSVPINGAHDPSVGRGTLALVGVTMATVLVVIVGFSANGKRKRRR